MQYILFEIFTFFIILIYVDKETNYKTKTRKLKDCELSQNNIKGSSSVLKYSFFLFFFLKKKTCTWQKFKKQTINFSFLFCFFKKMTIVKLSL